MASERVVTLVDSNILLDVLGPVDSEWRDWSEAMLRDAADAGMLAINPIIYAEVSVRYGTIEAHAAVRGHRVLTRDPRRYRAYFPRLEVIAPD